MCERNFLLSQRSQIFICYIIYSWILITDLERKAPPPLRWELGLVHEFSKEMPIAGYGKMDVVLPIPEEWTSNPGAQLILGGGLRPPQPIPNRDMQSMCAVAVIPRLMPRSRSGAADSVRPWLWTSSCRILFAQRGQSRGWPETSLKVWKTVNNGGSAQGGWWGVVPDTDVQELPQLLCWVTSAAPFPSRFRKKWYVNPKNWHLGLKVAEIWAPLFH